MSVVVFADVDCSLCPILLLSLCCIVPVPVLRFYCFFSPPLSLFHPLVCVPLIMYFHVISSFALPAYQVVGVTSNSPGFSLSQAARYPTWSGLAMSRMSCGALDFRWISALLDSSRFLLDLYGGLWYFTLDLHRSELVCAVYVAHLSANWRGKESE